MQMQIVSTGVPHGAYSPVDFRTTRTGRRGIYISAPLLLESMMKILVEKAVIEQALEALDMVTSCEYGSNTRERAMYQGSFTALREALDPELQFVRDWNEGKVRRVSDGKIMGVAEQAEQEPVAWHEPGAYSNVTVYKNWANENGWIPLYAAPVRTKDLTDDEILQTYINTPYANLIQSVRAVIAADREKNK